MITLTLAYFTLKSVFQSLKSLLLLSENLNKKEGVLQHEKTCDSEKHDQCPYCEGKGYFQLLLGGSETCVECCGSGKKRA